MVSFTKVLEINSSSDKVWNVFAHKFDEAYKWMASVNHSYAKKNGRLFEGAHSAGRVCELTPKTDGIKASEQFLAYNEQNQTAIVKIDFEDTPFIFPVKFNTLDFSLEDLGNNKSRMTWKFKSTTKFYGFFMQPALKKGFDKFVGQIMEELKHYVETGQPHPRKIKALSKSKKYYKTQKI